jgi:O-antigen/teichoic acid export membrane protein
MSETKGGAGDAAVALAIRVAGAGLVFGLQVLLARLMPAEGYGGFVTLWTWMLALGSFAALGFAESSIRFLPRYQLRGRGAVAAGFWRFGLAAVLATGLVSFALAATAGLTLGLSGPGLMVLLVALGLPFLGAEYYLEGVARSFGWFRLAAVPVYILRPVLIGGLCLLLAAAGVELTLPVVGAVLVGAMAVVTGGLALAVARRLHAVLPAGGPAASRRQKRLWLRASLPLLLLSGLEDLTGYADVLVLGLIADAEQVGIYFAAARSLALAGFVAYAMTLVFGRRFALDLAGRSREDLQRSILEASRLTLWATVASVAAAMIAAPLLLGAFGPAFLAGQGVLLVLGAGMVARAMAGQAGEVLIVAGRQREGLAIALFGLVMTVALALLLVPQLGMIGAAIAAAAAMACRTVALALVLRRAEGLRVLAFGLPQIRLR